MCTSGGAVAEPHEHLPLPPLEMRSLVGPVDWQAFDNPDGNPIFPEIEPDRYQSVFDFGCGCGRLARQLIQQDPRPRRYVGVDLHLGMIEWCRRNLAPVATGFEFIHHDVFELGFNPDPTKPAWRPFPVIEERFSLVICWSVFTHVLEDQAAAYLREIRRILGRGGIAVTTWFFFDKGDFPMMQDDQNALFINAVNPKNAVIFDRGWFQRAIADAGLMMTTVVPPSIRGFQWQIDLVATDSGNSGAVFPDDVAPRGINRPPPSPPNAHLIGLAGQPSNGAPPQP